MHFLQNENQSDQTKHFEKVIQNQRLQMKLCVFLEFYLSKLKSFQVLHSSCTDMYLFKFHELSYDCEILLFFLLIEVLWLS